MADISVELNDNLLPALANNEVRCLLLGAMVPGVVYGSRGMERLIHNMQGDPPVWSINHRTLFDYCTNTFGPIGLVAESVSLRGSQETVGYVRNALGDSIGESLAGYWLEFSETIGDTGLVEYWGATPSPSKIIESKSDPSVTNYRQRAPITRKRIFEALLNTSLPVSVFRISNYMKNHLNYEVEHRRINMNLLALNKVGVVTYSPQPTDHSQIVYCARQDTPDISSLGNIQRDSYSYETLVAIFNIINELSGFYLSSRDIGDILYEDLSHYYKNSDVLTATVRAATRALAEQKLICSSPKNTVDYPEVTLSGTQRQVIQRGIEISNLFFDYNDSIISDGKRLGREIRSTGSRVQRLLTKAKQTSVSKSRIIQ